MTKRRRLTITAGILLAVLSLLVTGYTLIINSVVGISRQLLPIAGLNKNLEGYQILFISDLYGKRFGSDGSGLVQTVSTLKFDVAVIGGGMLGADYDAQALLDLVKALLAAKKPILYLPGDVGEPAREPGAREAAYVGQLRQLGVVVLDSPQAVTVGASTIWFSPRVQLSWDIDNMRQAIVRQWMEAEDAEALIDIEILSDTVERLAEARTKMKSEDVQIVVSHKPWTTSFIQTVMRTSGGTEGISLSKVDGVLGGYYNGGQWRLPLAGALWVPDEALGLSGWLPAQEEVSGRSRTNGMTQIISPGLGVSPLYPAQPFRLFNPPQVVVAKLTGDIDG